MQKKTIKTTSTTITNSYNESKLKNALNTVQKAIRAIKNLAKNNAKPLNDLYVKRNRIENAHQRTRAAITQNHAHDQEASHASTHRVTKKKKNKKNTNLLGPRGFSLREARLRRFFFPLRGPSRSARSASRRIF